MNVVKDIHGCSTGHIYETECGIPSSGICQATASCSVYTDDTVDWKVTIGVWYLLQDHWFPGEVGRVLSHGMPLLKMGT